MEYNPGIVVTVRCEEDNYAEEMNKYRRGVEQDTERIRNVYAKAKACGGGNYLIAPLQNGNLLQELQAILSLKHPSKEYKHLDLNNGVRAIYAIGHIAYVLKLAIAFGLEPTLQIKESYEM